MKTLTLIFTVFLTVIQLNAQSFIDTYIHIVPDYGGATGELTIMDCADPSVTKTITFDGNPILSTQVTGIDGVGVKVLHFIASDGTNTYEFEANIDFSSLNPSISYTITPSIEPMSVIQKHKSSSPNCDGEINLIIAGGNAPTHVSWFQNGAPMTGTAGQTSLMGVCPGTYGYKFGDASTLCIDEGAMFSVTINEVSCLIMVQGTSGFGVCDGSAELYPTGTNPGGIVSTVISNTFGDQDATILDNQCAGLITGHVQDNTGGMAQCQNMITEPNELIIIIDGTTAQTSVPANGAVTFTITGGVQPYDTILDNGQSQVQGGPFDELEFGDYTLIVIDRNGNADAVDFTIDSHLSLKENEPLFELSIYPNPAKESIAIKGEDLNTVFIYDMNGREVVNQSLIGKTTVDLSQLESGVYTVKVQTTNQERVEKLIIQ